MDCLTCAANRGELKAPGGVIYEDGLWRIEHILEPIPLAGWLIAKPLRHVTSFPELTDEEAAAYGVVMHRAARALQKVTDAEKTYLCLFAEAPGFVHIHVHLIPAMRDWPPERRGPAVFDLIGEARRRGDLADRADAVAIAARVRSLLTGG